MSKEIENKREVDMSKYDKTREQTAKIVGEMFDKNINRDIWVNGIQGVQAILDMIKDTIDNGDTEDAKMWITELQNELLNNNVRG